MVRILVLLLLMLAPTAAHACVWMPISPPSYAQQRQGSRQQTEMLTRVARTKLAKGEAQIVADLAELLVPNVRPVFVMQSDCGPQGEVDFVGSLHQPARIPLDDPRLRRIDWGKHRQLITEFDGLWELGPACNLEFRRRFGSYLESNLPNSTLQDSWLFLIARKRTQDFYGSAYARLMVFEGRTRHPPVRWWGYDEWIRKDIDRFIQKRDAGRALAGVIEAFWREQEPNLDSDDRVCPTTIKTMREDRERLVAAILQAEQAQAIR